MAPGSDARELLVMGTQQARDGGREAARRRRRQCTNSPGLCENNVDRSACETPRVGCAHCVQASQTCAGVHQPQSSLACVSSRSAWRRWCRAGRWRRPTGSSQARAGYRSCCGHRHRTVALPFAVSAPASPTGIHHRRYGGSQLASMAAASRGNVARPCIALPTLISETYRLPSKRSWQTCLPRRGPVLPSERIPERLARW